MGGRLPGRFRDRRQALQICGTLKRSGENLFAQGKEAVAHGLGIQECIDNYLASREHELGSKTTGQYGIVLLRLQVFCEKQEVLHLDGVTVDLLETFKVEGLPKKMADTSKSTVVAKLRCFLRAAVSQWLDLRGAG